MKIIGQSSTGFVLTATKNEVANLVGWHSHTQHPASVAALEVGAVIRVDEMYQRLYSLARIKSQLADAADKLRNAAELAEEAAPVLYPCEAP